jgi:hypothetical protein
LKATKLLVGQEIGNGDEAVAIELLLQVQRYPSSEPSAALPSQTMRGPQPPAVKSRLVKSPRTQDRIVDEAFCPGENLHNPKRQSPPPRNFANPVAGNATLIKLQLVQLLAHSELTPEQKM